MISRENIRKFAEVYTPTHTVEKLLECIPFCSYEDKNKTILEPACGNGQIVVKIFQKRLEAGLSIDDALNTLIGLDIIERNVQETKDRLLKLISDPTTEQKNIIDKNILQVKDSLIYLNDFKADNLIVIMNPPYQKSNDKGQSKHHGSPLYHLFINKMIQLNPEYIVSINPSRWMSGGRGLTVFRQQMMKDKRIKRIVNFPGKYEIFKDVDVKGGVNYFVWQRDYNGPCEFISGNTSKMRYLDDYDIIIQDNEAICILEKVKSRSNKYFKNKWMGQTPFKIYSSFKDWKESGVPCYSREGLKFCDATAFKDRHKIIHKWKVVSGKANGSAQNKNKSGTKKVLSKLFIIEPGAICTQTYIVINCFDTKQEAENFLSYMKTRFFRFMLSLRMSSQDITRKRFAWVPDMENYSIPYTDEDVFKIFDLNRQEQEYIISKIRIYS
jgi:site-specific DNA-methyltransferase (adenine-specific)